MQKIKPCLWFDTEAEDAAEHYVSIFPNSPASSRCRTTATPGPGRRERRCWSAGSSTGRCSSGSTVVRSDGGEEGPCGWLKDRFGVSWQIVPERLNELLADPDPERAQRAMAAMMGMKKLNVAALEQAADGVSV